MLDVDFAYLGSQCVFEHCGARAKHGACAEG